MIKHYYAMLLMVCSAFSCAMEPAEIDKTIKSIRDKIDENILAIDPNGLGAWIKSTCVSYNMSRSFAGKPQGAIKLLRTVEGYITEEHCNDRIFQKLQSHWLVYYLIQELIKYKVQPLNDVTGHTIDNLLGRYNSIPILSSQMSSFINRSAYNVYMKSSKADGAIENFCGNDEHHQIHYKNLDAPGAGDICKLLMSEDGQYIKGVTGSGGELSGILKMEQLHQAIIEFLRQNVL